MQELTVIGESQNNVPSVTSTITGNSNDSIENDKNLSDHDKKRKIEDVYNSRRWLEEDKYEIQKVKHIVRNNVFQHVKFVKGEGKKHGGTIVERKASKQRKDYGKSHDKADLTKITGYEYNVMKLAGINEHNTSLTDRALWWKTYQEHIREEIRQMRGRMSASVKATVNEGKKVSLYFIITSNSNTNFYMYSSFNRKAKSKR